MDALSPSERVPRNAGCFDLAFFPLDLISISTSDSDTFSSPLSTFISTLLLTDLHSLLILASPGKVFPGHSLSPHRRLDLRHQHQRD